MITSASIVFRCSKMEIDAVKTAAIFRLAAKIPQTNFCSDYLKNPFLGRRALLHSMQFRVTQLLTGGLPIIARPALFPAHLGAQSENLLSQRVCFISACLAAPPQQHDISQEKHTWGMVQSCQIFVLSLYDRPTSISLTSHPETLIPSKIFTLRRNDSTFKYKYTQ